MAFPDCLIQTRILTGITFITLSCRYQIAAVFDCRIPTVSRWNIPMWLVAVVGSFHSLPSWILTALLIWEFIYLAGMLADTIESTCRNLQIPFIMPNWEAIANHR